MTAVHLRRVDPARNMRRFYRLDMQPDLFGGVLLVKELGAKRGRCWKRFDTRVLESLAKRLPEPRRPEVLDRALAAAEEIGNEEVKARALGSLTERLPEPRRTEVLDRALIIAEGIEDDEERAGALRSLAKRLPEPRRTEVLDRALAAAERIGDEEVKARALGSLTECLPEELLERALVMAHGIAEGNPTYDEIWALRLGYGSLKDEIMAQVFESLAERLPERLLDRAAKAAEGIWDDRKRAEVLGSLAVRLPEPRGIEVLNRALTIAEAISDDDERVQTLELLANRLKERYAPVFLAWLPDHLSKIPRRAGFSFLEKLAPLIDSTCHEIEISIAETILDVGNRWK